MTFDTTATETTDPTPVRLTANGLTLELDLHQVLTAVDPHGRYRGYDPDAEEDVFEPDSIQAQLMDQAAAVLVKSLRKDVAAVVTAAVQEQVKAQVIEIVTDVITAPVQRTNEWGSPVGEAKPLREVILAEAEAALTKPAGDSYGNRGRQTVVQKIVADEITKAFKTELQQHVKQAQGAAVAAVKASAAEVIGETIDRARRGLV